MFRNRRQKVTGILLLAIIFLIAGCASKQTVTTRKRPATAAPKAQIPTESAEQQKAPAQKVKHAEPLNSSLIASKFKQEKPEVQEVAVDQADIEFVEQRLQAYEKKFQKWLEVTDRIAEDDESAALQDETDCVQQFERILAGYSLLFERLLHNNTVPFEKIHTIDPSHMQQLDIAFLESSCAAMLEHDTMFADTFLTETEDQPFSFAQLTEQFNASMAEGSYQEAQSNYMQLLQLFPSRQPDFNTQYLFGQALQHTDQVEAAARHYNKMLADASYSVGPTTLQRQIADLLLASGNPAAAISAYEKLNVTANANAAEKTWADEQLAFLRSADPGSDEMIAYMKLLHEFMANDYKIHGAELNEKLYTFALDFAGNPITDNAMRLKTFSESQLRFWFGQQLTRVDSMVQEKKFQEAQETLNQLSGYFLSLELQAVLQRTHNEVTLAEARENEALQQLEEMALAEQWDAAVNLLDSRNYDGAILAFEAFQETAYADQAQVKTTEAANLAAGQLRKEAAALFIKASKTSDIERKKELLMASYQLLIKILDNYPQTELLNKVNQNISVLEEQINRLDPSLLEEPVEDQIPLEPMQGQMSGHRF